MMKGMGYGNLTTERFKSDYGLTVAFLTAHDVAVRVENVDYILCEVEPDTMRALHERNPDMPAAIPAYYACDSDNGRLRLYPTPSDSYEVIATQADRPPSTYRGMRGRCYTLRTKAPKVEL